MRGRKVAQNFGFAALSQGLSLIISALMSLIIPKFLGVEEFAYWQLFIFYVSYAGFFMFGLNDGIYLIEGGRERSQLDVRSLSSQFFTGMGAQLVVAVTVATVAFSLVDQEKRLFVFVAAAAYLVVANGTTFIGYIFQATNETKLYSFSLMIDRLAYLVPLAVITIMGVTSFEPYVVAYIASRLCALVYCLYKGRYIFAKGVLGPLRALSDSWSSVKVGINLMLANIAGLLILGIARLVVDAHWGLRSFGEFSFALTLENLFLIFIAELAMVLFPALRHASDVDKRKSFFAIGDALSLILPLSYVLYFPIVLTIRWWLPAYVQALSYLALILPMGLFESRMNLLGTTYFKVLRRERRLLLVNMVTVAVSAVGVLIGAYLFQSLPFIMLWITAVIMLQSVYSEAWVALYMGASLSKQVLLEILLTVIFLATTKFLDLLPAFVIVLCAYGVYVALGRRKVLGLVRSFR